MPFLPPNYERQSTEGIYLHIFTLEKWKQNLLQGIISISSHLKENNTTITQNLLLSWFQYLSTAAKNVHVHETHTHLTALFLGQPGVSWYQTGKTNLDFTEARDSEWQWHQLGYMQVCTSLQTDNHASNPPLSFLQARCPSCCPTNSVKAVKANQQSRANRLNPWPCRCQQRHAIILLVSIFPV